MFFYNSNILKGIKWKNISKSIKNKKVMEKYFQVAITVRYGEVLKRELRSLKNTEDHYPKYLITMDMDL